MLTVQGEDGMILLNRGSGQAEWSGVLPKSQDYIVSVISTGSAADYSLDGHHPTADEVTTSFRKDLRGHGRPRRSYHHSRLPLPDFGGLSHAPRLPRSSVTSEVFLRTSFPCQTPCKPYASSKWVSLSKCKRRRSPRSVLPMCSCGFGLQEFVIRTCITAPASRQPILCR